MEALAPALAETFRLTAKPTEENQGALVLPDTSGELAAGLNLQETNPLPTDAGNPNEANEEASPVLPDIIGDLAANADLTNLQNEDAPATPDVVPDVDTNSDLADTENAETHILPDIIGELAADIAETHPPEESLVLPDILGQAATNFELEAPPKEEEPAGSDQSAQAVLPDVMESVLLSSEGLLNMGGDHGSGDVGTIADSVRETVEGIANSVLGAQEEESSELLDIHIEEVLGDITRGSSQEPEAGTFDITAADTIDGTIDTTIEADEVPEIDEDKPKKKRRRDVETPIVYSNQELEDAYDEFQKNKTLPSFLMKDAILDYGRRRSLDFMMVEDYDAAYKNDMVVNDLLLAFSKDSGGFSTDSIASYLDSRIQSIREQRASTQQRYDESISAMREKQQKKLERLLALQQEERDNFERDCTSSEFLKKFSKPSTELLQLRKIQKGLALAHKFDEAKSVKAQGDRMQHQETLSAQSRAGSHIRTAYAQLLDRQRQQLVCAAENGQRKIRLLEESFAREDEANANVVRQLKIRLQGTKTKKGPGLPPLLVAGSKTGPSESTRLQMRKFKRPGNVSKLDVKLTDVKGIIGTRSPPTMKSVKIV
jgi:hypothetical protein